MSFQHVRDTGGTVIFSIDRTLTGGSKKTVEFAVEHNKPWLHVHPGMKDAAEQLRYFADENEVALNVTLVLELHNRRRIRGVAVGVDHPRLGMVRSAQRFCSESA
jgi:hypothetical protein